MTPSPEGLNMNDEQWKFNEWVTDLADPFWLKDAQKEGEFFDANGFARVLLSASKPAVPMGLPQPVLDALRFYAHGHHYSIDDSQQQFDTVSGEPQNWMFSERDDDCTMIEDGGIAKAVLLGGLPGFEEPTESLEGEVFSLAASPAAPAQSGEPVGYLMKHRSGTDQGFAWRKDDPQFYGEWERIPLYAAPPSQHAVGGEPVAYTTADRLKKVAERDRHVDTMWPASMRDEGDIPLYAAPPSQHAVGGETREKCAGCVERCTNNPPDCYASAVVLDDERAAKPCPFCGSSATLHERHTDDGKPFYFQCDGCFIEVAYARTREDSLAQWNHRAASPQPENGGKP